jgi:hypothetical protein
VAEEEEEEAGPGYQAYCRFVVVYSFQFLLWSYVVLYDYLPTENKRRIDRSSRSTVFDFSIILNSNHIWKCYSS